MEQACSVIFHSKPKLASLDTKHPGFLASTASAWTRRRAVLDTQDDGRLNPDFDILKIVQVQGELPLL